MNFIIITTAVRLAGGVSVVFVPPQRVIVATDVGARGVGGSVVGSKTMSLVSNLSVYRGVFRIGSVLLFARVSRGTVVGVALVTFRLDFCSTELR